MAIAILLAAAGSASAQKGLPTGRGSHEQLVSISRIDNLYVGPQGIRPGPYQGVPGRACNQIVAHTDANFQGGSFTVQAGFGQGEMTAATYTVPAGEWPIKINLTEVILATANSTVNTTTQWSLLYYQGTPTNGTLVETYSSDGVILPHAIIPAGTNGLNVQFSIDPNDPEQLILQDNGSHQFTVAFRIDVHNNQTANPCFTAPPTSSNAFPTTDVSGLASAANNWLFGLNCGPFGCPANGGWATFAALPGFCRPSGDWVMRTTWSSVLNCTPGIGACCLPSGGCQVLSLSECNIQNGNYQGDGTPCGTCPQPSGACCFTNGACLQFSSADCTTAGGTWLGAGTSCNGGSCPTGACCLPSGQCVPGVTSAQCSSQGGTFRGVGTNCSNPCPQPTGACCLGNGNCLTLNQADCGQIPGSSWGGAASSCATACVQPCYPNCDQSTAVPVLTANDFQCFLNSYASNESYANCDQSTTSPVLTANDFSCFLNRYASGCS
jgi:hypothetical protein